MTGIPYCDATWSPLVGCSPAGPGCAHCWAARQMRRIAACQQGRHPERMELPLHSGLVDGDGCWTGEVRFIPERLEQPLRWRTSRTIFVCPMSDLFHEHVHYQDLGRIFGTMAEAHRHRFLVFTKRLAYALAWSRGVAYYPSGDRSQRPVPGWPPNVWLILSASTQAEVDEGVPLLLRTPAAHRGLSLEPLLERVCLSAWLPDVCCDGCNGHPLGLAMGQTHEVLDSPDDRFPDLCGQMVEIPGAEWVIVGAESGPGHRPCDPAWILSVVEQCDDAGVCVYVKQGSAMRSGQQANLPDYLWGRKEVPW